MVKYVLFDLDNTLLIGKPTIPEKVFELVLKSHPDAAFKTVEQAYAASELWQGRQIQKENETGVRMSDEEYCQNLFNVYQEYLPLDDSQADNFYGIFTHHTIKAYQLMPDAVAVLSHLKEKGLSLGVVSNNCPSVRQVLLDLKIEHFFDCIVISEEVDLYKPDPQIMEYACRQIGVRCEESIYVGDHPFDVVCAHAANMPVIWMPFNRFITFPDGFEKPEHTIHALQELKDILI